MKKESVKAILTKYNTYSFFVDHLLNDINITQQEIDELYQLTGVSYDGMPVKGNSISDKTYSSAEEIVELREALEERVLNANTRIQRMNQRREIIDDVVEYELTSAEQEIFLQRYVKGLGWKNVLDGYSDCFKSKNEDSMLRKMGNALGARK